ncbi:MAG: polymer-forming cytoskeletal protein [Myxococcota bacterium]|nr:polymer-forming cytoskeletal protein [Myxococcota bacterium]
MAIGNFSRTRSEQAESEGTEPKRPSPPVSSQSSVGTLSAFIDQGSEFEGKLSFRDTVRIDGLFRGEIRSENTLVIGETGEIEADVTSGHVVISGSLIGNVRAEKGIVLHKTARVQGDVMAPSLVIEEGAVLNGSVEMTPPTKAPAALPAPPLAPREDDSAEED